MNRTLVASFVLLTLACGAATAQEELIPPKRSNAAKVGAVGGFTTQWLFLDVAPVNDFLKSASAPTLSTGGVFLYGGAGSAYIMLFKNFRVGGIGMGGSISSSALDQTSNVRRDVKLSAGYGAVTLEYVVPIVPRLDLVTGIALGAGGIDLELRKSNGQTSTWDGEASSLKANDLTAAGSITRTLNGHFFIWSPSVSLEYAFLGFMGVRAGVSYLGMSSPSWKVDDNYDLLNVPSSVSGKGVTVNLALLVGTF